MLSAKLPYQIVLMKFPSGHHSAACTHILPLLFMLSPQNQLLLSVVRKLTQAKVNIRLNKQMIPSERYFPYV